MRSVGFSALLVSIVAVFALSGPVQAGSTVLYGGSSPYLSFTDSPFYGVGMDYFFLEDFEDFALNTPGVTASAGYSTKPTWDPSVTDSVDGDDGVIDGYGTRGNSWFAGDGATGVTFTFDAGALGALPTDVGIVWTDGSNPLEFRAYDAGGILLGAATVSLAADGVYTGTTAEDTFFGMHYDGGIAKIHLFNGASGIEMDHLQYGRSHPIPAPGAVILASVGAGLVSWLRRRRAL